MENSFGDYKPMRRVLIGTPCYDGKIDVWHANSLVNAIRIAEKKGIFLHPVWMSYDALIQRARNDLLAMVLDGEYDDIIFIDSDVEFSPEWIFKLLDCEEDVVGGTYPKKGEEEMYPVKGLVVDGGLNLNPDERGLLEVEGLGTGFVRISRKAVQAVWDASVPYFNKEKGTVSRMMCQVEVVDGDLVSEDMMLFRKLRSLGFRVWLDVDMTCNHVGNKKYTGNFKNYINRMFPAVQQI
jgi:glycosyltransferase involved in cell wall biosynthesis